MIGGLDVTLTWGDVLIVAAVAIIAIFAARR